MSERPYKRHRIALPVDAVEKLTELEASDDRGIPPEKSARQK